LIAKGPSIYNTAIRTPGCRVLFFAAIIFPGKTGIR